MESNFWENFWANVSVAHKMLSNWLMGAAGTAGTVWFSLPPEQQKSLVEHSLLPPWSYPVVLTALGVFLRVLPQHNLTTKEAESKSAQNVPPAQGETT